MFLPLYPSFHLPIHSILPLHPPTTSTHRIHHIRERYNAVHQEGSTANGTACWHTKENYNRAVQAVQEMEKKMDILVRWTVDDEEYENAEALVASRHYRLALNKLEELVIKRLFELTKMNMSGTGMWWSMIFTSH
jgi:hypothetical protein